MRIIFLSFVLLTSLVSFSQKHVTQFELSGGNESPRYEKIIQWWKELDDASPLVQMKEIGPTDSGHPLHLVLISTSENFDKKDIAAIKNTILINNGIHPGEPDGIDASMILARDIVQNKYKLPSSIILAIIPVYNIGGAINRSTNYRVDQNGPIEKGFRGNSQNLDLNRDFIKMDSKEAMSFARIFTMLDPDVFIDNHVSNGADYQHVITLLASQHNKLGGSMGEFMNNTFEPALYPLMKKKGFDLVPYVNHFGDGVEKGWQQFYDSPRYGSGYGTIMNTFSFVPETHMLKPYKQRVEATRALMESFIEFTAQHGKEIKALREQTNQTQASQTVFPIAWKLDKTKSIEINFKGYESGYKTSEVSGLSRLYYDRNKPYEKKIPFFNTYFDTLSVQKPSAYLIPQGWWKVIERLQANGIQMERLKTDTAIYVEAYRIENYQSRSFEGHHLNRNIQVSKTRKQIQFKTGDYYIPTDQKNVRFLIEVLEPQAEDSYFAWNFFDAVLAEKEGFSSYVFEETAAEFLKTHPDVKQKLEDKKRIDPAFAKNAYAQLDFVYKNSPYSEPAHNQYPVYRVM